MPDQKTVWFVIDELASLQRLPQLHTAITENRKSQNPIILAFKDAAKCKARYGEDAEANALAASDEIFLRTTDHGLRMGQRSYREIEIERLARTHYDGSRPGPQLRARPADRAARSAFGGFPVSMTYGFPQVRQPRCAISFPFIALEGEEPRVFDERKMDDLIVPSTRPFRTGGDAR